MTGTDPGIALKANKEAMAIIAARPFCIYSPSEKNDGKHGARKTHTFVSTSW